MGKDALLLSSIGANQMQSAINGNGVEGHIPLLIRRPKDGLDEVRVARYYQKHGRSPTLAKYKISDARLYPILHREGVKLNRGGNKLNSRITQRKARTAARAAPGRGVPAPPAKRQPRKPIAAGKGARIADALTYCGHARDRARDLGQAGEAIVGLLALAMESLGHRE